MSAGLVRRDPPRVPSGTVARFAPYRVATVHEGRGRRGLLASYMRPVWPRARAIGTAVTVSVPPADNWMIHVAVEQCGEGDMLVVAPTSPSDAGYFGELLACTLAVRGVVGLAIASVCRASAAVAVQRLPGVS